MRNCQGPGCEASLDGMKSTARYCSSTCRARAAEERKVEGLNPRAFWRGVSQVRRFARA